MSLNTKLLPKISTCSTPSAKVSPPTSHYQPLTTKTFMKIFWFATLVSRCGKLKLDTEAGFFNLNTAFLSRHMIFFISLFGLNMPTMQTSMGSIGIRTCLKMRLIVRLQLYLLPMSSGTASIWKLTKAAL